MELHFKLFVAQPGWGRFSVKKLTNVFLLFLRSWRSVYVYCIYKNKHLFILFHIWSFPCITWIFSQNQRLQNLFLMGWITKKTHPNLISHRQTANTHREIPRVWQVSMPLTASVHWGEASSSDTASSAEPIAWSNVKLTISKVMEWYGCQPNNRGDFTPIIWWFQTQGNKWMIWGFYIPLFLETSISRFPC